MSKSTPSPTTIALSIEGKRGKIRLSQPTNKVTKVNRDAQTTTLGAKLEGKINVSARVKKQEGEELTQVAWTQQRPGSSKTEPVVHVKLYDRKTNQLNKTYNQPLSEFRRTEARAFLDEAVDNPTEFHRRHQLTQKLLRQQRLATANPAEFYSQLHHKNNSQPPEITTLAEPLKAASANPGNALVNGAATTVVKPQGAATAANPGILATAGHMATELAKGVTVGLGTNFLKGKGLRRNRLMAAAALAGGSLDVAHQLVANRGDVGKVNWGRALGYGATSAMVPVLPQRTRFLPAVLQGSLVGGTSNGVMSAATQWGETGKIDAAQTGMDVGMGALFGGALSGVGPVLQRFRASKPAASAPAATGSNPPPASPGTATVDLQPVVGPMGQSQFVPVLPSSPSSQAALPSSLSSSLPVRSPAASNPIRLRTARQIRQAAQASATDPTLGTDALNEALARQLGRRPLLPGTSSGQPPRTTATNGALSPVTSQQLVNKLVLSRETTGGPIAPRAALNAAHYLKHHKVLPPGSTPNQVAGLVNALDQALRRRGTVADPKFLLAQAVQALESSEAAKQTLALLPKGSPIARVLGQQAGFLARPAGFKPVQQQGYQGLADQTLLPASQRDHKHLAASLAQLLGVSPEEAAQLLPKPRKAGLRVLPPIGENYALGKQLAKAIEANPALLDALPELLETLRPGQRLTQHEVARTIGLLLQSGRTPGSMLTGRTVPMAPQEASPAGTTSGLSSTTRHYVPNFNEDALDEALHASPGGLTGQNTSHTRLPASSSPMPEVGDDVQQVATLPGAAPKFLPSAAEQASLPSPGPANIAGQVTSDVDGGWQRHNQAFRDGWQRHQEAMDKAGNWFKSLWRGGKPPTENGLDV